MTDLTEMVEWLRRTIEGDRKRATEIARYTDSWRAFSGYGGHRWFVSGQDMGDPVCDLFNIGAESIAAEHIATHDPRDTIARCEAELAIIARAELVLNAGPDDRDPEMPDVLLAAPGRRIETRRNLRLLASAYHYRDGYKASWTA